MEIVWIDSAFGSPLQWPEITTVDYVSPVYESLDSPADLAGLSPVLGDQLAVGMF